MVEFLVLALLAGLGVAVIAGPLGCFVVWKRMAYFGDTLAHSALLGVSVSLWLQVNTMVAVVVTCTLIATLLLSFQRQFALATDTLLGILAHSSLALGIIAISLNPSAGFNLEGLLFGDLLAVTRAEVAAIWGVSVITAAALWWQWQSLLAVTVHEELAQVEGRPVRRLNTLFTLALALMIAISMKVVGVLLITSLLIIPAATARVFARSPADMALRGSLLGCAAVAVGLGFSWYADTPVGPSIVLAAAAGFVLTQLLLRLSLSPNNAP